MLHTNVKRWKGFALGRRKENVKKKLRSHREPAAGCRHRKQLVEPPGTRFLPLCTDNPPDRQPPVAWRMRLEDLPGGAIRLERRFARVVEPRVVADGVQRDGPRRIPRLECLPPGGAHAAKPHKLLRTFGVDGAPETPRPPGCKAV